MSFAFRHHEKFAAVDAFLTKRHRPGPGGALVLDERGPDGGRLLCWPSRHLLAVETRLGALLAGDQDNWTLQPAANLPIGDQLARTLLGEAIGVDPGAGCEVRRYDLAYELHFGETWRALAFLRTVAGMCPARMRLTEEKVRDGTLMTVYHRTAKRGVIVLRVYDKGRESGSHPPLEQIRLEAQVRPPKRKRQTPDVLAQTDLGPVFGRTLMPYIQDHGEVVAAGAEGGVTYLMQRQARGEITATKRDALLGSIVALRHAGSAAYIQDGANDRSNRRRYNRRLAELRKHGVALDQELPAEAVVPVGEMLRQAVAEFAA